MKKFINSVISFFKSIFGQDTQVSIENNNK